MTKQYLKRKEDQQISVNLITLGSQLCGGRCGQEEVRGGLFYYYFFFNFVLGGLHGDHDHHGRGDQRHGRDQGRPRRLEQEAGVSGAGELLITRP